ncbi:MAG: 16S rRNA (guanine(966)-N(2))-methyltransferase RsmD [Clostridiales bacterium]|nr:16S rRNA (guanine(966)-N(2))-methyltransferase RsmD [Clostridiales bacterium]
MRIIAGRWKGRKLLSLKGTSTRPTYDRVKEAMFNILQAYIPDSLVLDLFAGTGNLGLEALSRGCKKVVFVEKNPRAVEILNQNRRNLGCFDQSHVVCDDVFHAIRYLSGKERFDVVFADPPYNEGMDARLIYAIAESDVMQPDGIIMLEHSSRSNQPDEAGDIKRIQTRKYGNTSISIYRKCRSDD